MRGRVSALVILATAILMTAIAPSMAQAPGGFGADQQGRDCQTVTTRNFSRYAAVRGALSSYSCKRCELVLAKCAVGTGGGVCERFRCRY